MQDVFIEYLVKKQNTPATLLMKLGLAVAGVLVFLVAFMFSSVLGAFSFAAILIGVGAIYGAYYLITSMNLEYEYSVTNGEMDVDKIIAQRKRKRLISVNCKTVEAFGRYKPQEHANKSYQTKIFACDNPANPELWYAVVRHKEKGQTLVVFNANEKMLNGMKPFLPGPIMHAAFRIGG